jgi:hypothetical protein
LRPEEVSSPAHFAARPHCKRASPSPYSVAGEPATVPGTRVARCEPNVPQASVESTKTIGRDQPVRRKMTVRRDMPAATCATCRL